MLLHCFLSFPFRLLLLLLYIIAVTKCGLITVLSNDKLVFPAAIVSRGHYTALYTSGLYYISTCHYISYITPLTYTCNTCTFQYSSTENKLDQVNCRLIWQTRHALASVNNTPVLFLILSLEVTSLIIIWINNKIIPMITTPKTLIIINLKKHKLINRPIHCAYFYVSTIWHTDLNKFNLFKKKIT